MVMRRLRDTARETRLQQTVQAHIPSSLVLRFTQYHCSMHRQSKLPPGLEQYLDFCQREYERMQRDGSWPWRQSDDSTLSDHLVESEDTHDIV